MRKDRKRLTACLLAAVVASSAVAGCQKPGQGQETVEGLVEKTGVPGKEEGEAVEGRGYSKGKTWEAKEPGRARLSPDDYEGWNRLLDENGVSEAFREGLGQFAYESGSAVLKGAKGNGNYSPLSLYYTLALAGCGAQGETAAQILEKLGAADQKELAGQCRKLYQWYAYRSQMERERMEHYGMEGYQSAIQLANSLWVSDQLPVYEQYQKLAADEFFASSYGVDFKDPDTGKEMGGWIAKKTNGTLAPKFDLDPATLLVILNTLYFYGGWAEPFSEGQTQEDVFYLEGGGQVTVPYLNRTEAEGAFRKGDGYTLSYLGTDNGCQMMFLLPDEGRAVGEFLENPEKLREAMEAEEESWVDGKVIWKVPKFSFGCSYPLNDTLKAMGMGRMFDGQAEFGGISPEPLQVSSVIQQTHIGVDEQGVEGAAFTMMAMARGALAENEEVAEMALDRPFLFGVRDASHGIWLFLGVCRNPAEEGQESGADIAEGREIAGREMPEENGLLLDSPPKAQLTDVLSSTMGQFSIQPGSYSWKCREGRQMRAVEACSSHPLSICPEKGDILKVPDYNGMEGASYMFHCAVMPQTLTVREWDISQLGTEEGAEPSVKEYTGQEVILLRHDKVYEIVAKWPEEDLEEKGFSGKASYVVVTD